MSDNHQISVLTGVEAIQLRPGMYIGSSANPNHLVQEVLDNAIDELMEGFADTITIDIDNNNHRVLVTDNGRGIPNHGVKLEHGEIVDSIQIACTELHSGSKFKDSSYKFSAGMHGVGLVAVNALSKLMNVYVINNGTMYSYHFVDGKFVEKQVNTPDPNISWSTAIEFTINETYFNTPSINIDKFNNRLYLIKAKYPNSNLFMNSNTIPSITMNEYVSFMMGYQTPVEFMHVHKQSSTYDINIWFKYDPKTSSKTIGDVNGIICGGTYQTNFETAYFNAVSSTIKESVPRSIILNGVQAYISAMLTHTEFNSQTKEYMTRNISSIMSSFKDLIVNKIKTNTQFKTQLQKAIDEYNRQKLARHIKTATKKVDAENPVYDSVKIPGDTLYILEGESALGTMKQIRHIQTEGLFPLSGKILNVEKATVDKIFTSKKFKYFIQAIGIDFKQKNQTSFRYKRIKILTDSDSDGAHISVLVLIALWKFCKQLFIDNKIEILIPPLYGTYVNNQFVPIFTANERSKYNNVTRFKGIGEMDPQQLEVIIRNSQYSYIVQPPSDEQNAKHIIQCVTDTEVKRALCNVAELSIPNFIEKTVNSSVINHC